MIPSLPGLGEAGEGGVQRLRGRHVDGRERERLAPSRRRASRRTSRGWRSACGLLGVLGVTSCVVLGVPPGGPAPTLVDGLPTGPGRSWEDHADASSPSPTRAAPRARTRATLLVLASALALVLGGCGGKDAGEKKRDDKPGTSAGPSANEEPAADPGSGAPKVGECYRMTAAQSRRLGGQPARSGARASPRTPAWSPTSATCAIPGHRQDPGRRAPGARRRSSASRPTDALVGGTLADRATSLLTWTLFTPGQDELERGARWVRCDVLARSGDKLVAAAGRRTRCSPRACPSSCASARPTPASTSPAPGRTPSGSQAVFRAPPGQRAYPDAAAYTAVARARCQAAHRVRTAASGSRRAGRAGTPATTSSAAWSGSPPATTG